ncbi:MAG: biopolymer transportern ExbD [Rariglobus sp.]|jgi:biopolymer transport protein ExbD|nr:biopolymer transportern ExbD [Rariglobus sp.]
MARTFRQRRQMHAVSELNVTNLLDLAFVLLIIFMIATPLITQSEQTVPVDLPVESQSPQSTPDPDAKKETIVIRADGTCLLGSSPVALARLPQALATYARQSKQPVFHIRMDAKSTAQQFISVMDALKQNNLSKISFDTQTGS